MKVIPTIPEDLDVIIRIEQKSENKHFIFPYTLERHKKVINADDEFHFTIFDNEELIGFIILAITEKEHDSIEFRRIVIDQKGEGHGRKAVKWIKEWAFKDFGAYRLWLDVFPDNPRAIKLYSSEGFVEEGKRRSSIETNGHRRDQIVMSILRPEYTQ